jgi:hypothetical protein
MGQQAIAFLDDVPVLEISADVLSIARDLVSAKLMPMPVYAGDAIHIALAIFHRMEFVLSWNVKHLANINKRKHLASYCEKLGFPTPFVITPDTI